MVSVCVVRVSEWSLHTHTYTAHTCAQIARPRLRTGERISARLTIAHPFQMRIGVSARLAIEYECGTGVGSAAPVCLITYVMSRAAPRRKGRRKRRGRRRSTRRTSE